MKIKFLKRSFILFEISPLDQAEKALFKEGRKERRAHSQNWPFNCWKAFPDSQETVEIL